MEIGRLLLLPGHQMTLHFRGLTIAMCVDVYDQATSKYISEQSANKSAQAS